ncbi:MAG: hypothetical protein NTY77_05755 [Elusimicrobia bacterium]|nr:hypothetical protein [Elusimicrobiota bacterium]
MRTMLLAACAAAVLAMNGAQSWAAEAPAPAGKGGGALDTLVTVRVKGVPIASFLDNISAQAKVNFIITEGVEDKQVTAFLQNVTAREALQVLLEIKGLTYQQLGRTNTYIIGPRTNAVEAVATRIYMVNHVEFESFKGDAPIVQAVRSVLSKVGRVVADPQTNAMVVTDFPDVFPQVEQVIAALDQPARKVKGK